MENIARLFCRCILAAMPVSMVMGNGMSGPVVTVENGVIEGTLNSGVCSFKGVPFAKPPVGELRWQPPQPAENWDGVRKANRFGPRAMQRPLFGDMGFRSDGMSEDCLYLNVWAPEDGEEGALPVLVYFYGGGFQAGDGSEARYDGESMARRGIVTLTVNYRLNVFGFMAHPDLSAESSDGASGNYGLMDQQAALAWVRRNIAAFGGDPDRVTIAGESAGSISVSAHMASPLSRDLFAGAIGESGSLMGTLTPVPLTDAEETGRRFAENAGASTLSELRAMSAGALLEELGKPGAPWFMLTIDGRFFDEDPAKVFAEGRQSAVPLLVGANSEEMGARAVMGESEMTVGQFKSALGRLYPEHAEEAFRVYAATSDAEVEQAATDLAGDRFIGYSTWKWADVHAKAESGPVFRYFYARPRPAMRPEMGNATPGLAGGVNRNASDAPPPPPAMGAVHSAEIEYAMGNLSLNQVYAWTPDDYKVSATLQGYFENFIKTGDPNGAALPPWPKMMDEGGVRYMHIDAESGARVERNRDRYLFLDRRAAEN